MIYNFSEFGVFRLRSSSYEGKKSVQESHRFIQIFGFLSVVRCVLGPTMMDIQEVERKKLPPPFSLKDENRYTTLVILESSQELPSSICSLFFHSQSLFPTHFKWIGVISSRKFEPFLKMNYKIFSLMPLFFSCEIHFKPEFVIYSTKMKILRNHVVHRCSGNGL